MMKSKAAVFRGVDQGFEIQEFPCRPPERGEILVRIRMSTICGSDLHTVLGHRSAPVPIILGHEIVGTVAELGAGVTADTMGHPLKVGDRITWTIFANCGNCYYCKIKALPMKCVKLFKYGHETCQHPPHLNGGYAEYVYIAPGTYVFKVPDELLDTEVAPINCGLATAVQALDTIGVFADDAAVVQGAGTLGLYASAALKDRGAGLVIVVDVVPERLEMARRFGADVVLNARTMTADALVEEIRRLTGGWGADLAIEMAGKPDVVPWGIKALRKGGRFAEVGNVFPGAHFTLDGYDLITRWITVKGVHNYDALQLAEALNFVTRARARFPFRELVTHTFPLDEIVRGFDVTRAQQAIRVAITP